MDPIKLTRGHSEMLTHPDGCHPIFTVKVITHPLRELELVEPSFSTAQS